MIQLTARRAVRPSAERRPSQHREYRASGYAGKPGRWCGGGWGLREFSQNRYPKLWPPFEDYFPGGLVNSDGEQVIDLLEECCSRDIHGVPCHARGVECPDREHFCYTMDRNNPVWREYLKAFSSTRLSCRSSAFSTAAASVRTAYVSSACICKSGRWSSAPELKDIDLDTFHYGQWLLERGYDFKQNRESTPLF